MMKIVNFHSEPVDAALYPRKMIHLFSLFASCSSLLDKTFSLN